MKVPKVTRVDAQKAAAKIAFGLDFRILAVFTPSQIETPDRRVPIIKKPMRIPNQASRASRMDEREIYYGPRLPVKSRRKRAAFNCLGQGRDGGSFSTF
jgi:hypothetical protein